MVRKILFSYVVPQPGFSAVGLVSLCVARMSNADGLPAWVRDHFRASPPTSDSTDRVALKNFLFDCSTNGAITPAATAPKTLSIALNVYDLALLHMDELTASNGAIWTDAGHGNSISNASVLFYRSSTERLESLSRISMDRLK
jgi:hypothetical protein